MAVDSKNALVSLAEAKGYIPIKTATTTYDSIVETIIDGVSWLFNNYCNRWLKARDIEGVYDGAGSTLWLKTPPINEVTSLKVGGADYADYKVYKDMGKLSGNFGQLEQGIEISYNGGYTVIPYDLKHAALMQIKEFYRQHELGLEAVSSQSIEGGSISFIDRHMLPQVKQVLDKYRLAGHFGCATESDGVD